MVQVARQARRAYPLERGRQALLLGLQPALRRRALVLEEVVARRGQRRGRRGERGRAAHGARPVSLGRRALLQVRLLAGRRLRLLLLGAARSPRLASDLGARRGARVLRARRVRRGARARQRVLAGAEAAARAGARAHGADAAAAAARRARRRAAGRQAPGEARVAAAVLLGLEPQRGDAVGHDVAGLDGGRGRAVVRVDGRAVGVVGRRGPRVRAGGRGGGDGRAGDAEARAHAGQHGGGGLADVAARERARRVEAVHGADLRVGVVVVVPGRLHDAAQRVHGPGEALAVEGRGHLRRPVVVRVDDVVVVEGVGVGEGLPDEAVEARGAEAGLEVLRDGRRGVERVALLLPPLGPPILEPDLQHTHTRNSVSFLDIHVQYCNNSIETKEDINCG